MSSILSIVEDEYVEGSDTESKSAEDEEKKDDSSRKSLVCHVPDEVVYADHTRTLPYMTTLQGVLMFLDISGFISLTEKCSMNSKNGTDQLTKTLKGYMRTLVSEIILYDGDILKFAGDAILTLWKVEHFKTMKATVMHVLQCALKIQEKCGKYKTSVGVTLRVKIGIASGETLINYFGNEEFCHHVTMGRAVESVNQAEKFCVSGDVVISRSAWVHCAGLPVCVEMKEDEKHRKVIDINNPKMRDIMEQYETNRTTELSKSQAKLLDIKEKKVRKAVTDELDELTVERLRLYIPNPVLKKLDASQPLEYLSEIRQVTIVFINLSLKEATKFQICQTLQPAFQATFEELKKVQGLLNKVFMFGKGCTFLAILGLPGFKHDDDCARALKCSFEICKRLMEMEKISKASVGVTTGPSYCGVVGHPHRQEYTVIGRKVNMAARLMMAYDGKVTCDNETYHHSKLHKANFVSLEFRTMKGLQNIGTIREYKGNQGRKHNIDALREQEVEFPLIGRLEEVKTFLTELHKIRGHPEAGDKTKVILLNGAPGLGRTRLLDALVVKAANEGVRVVFSNLNMDDAKTPYHAVQLLLMDLLELEMEATHQQREHTLYQTFKDHYILSHMSLLNDFLHIKVPHNSGFAHMDADARTAAFHSLLFKMVHEVSVRKGFVMFAVYDAHYMDQESWEFVEELGCDTHALVLMSVKQGSRFMQHKTAQSVLGHSTTTQIELSGLEYRYLGPLACQILGVVSIPEPLENILRLKSHGVPSWCEQLLYSMLEDELLSIIPDVSSSDSASCFSSFCSIESDGMPIPRAQARVSAIECNESLQLPGSDMEFKQKRKILINQEMLAAQSINVQVKMTCSLAPDITLSDVRIPESIKGMIQSRIDKMNELDQIVIKSASVLGNSFRRQMLEAVLPKTLTSSRLQERLACLASNNVFECGSRLADVTQGIVYTTNQDNYQRKYICHCPKGPDAKEKTVNDCDILCFKSASLQETAITMYTESLRHEIHLEAAKYLESLAHKCPACGGGDFIPTAQVSTVNPEKKRFGGEGLSDGTAKIKTSTLSKLRKRHLSRGPLNQTEGATETIAEIQTEARIHAESTSTIVAFDEVIRGVIDSEQEQRETLMDVRDCSCLNILLSIFPQLIRHWRATGNLEKTVHFLMESGAASIAVDSNIQALSYLKEVSRILKCLDNDEDPFDEEVSYIQKHFFNNWIRARNESLIGQALYYMGHLDEATPHFSRALAILECVQPTSNFGVHIKIWKEKFKQWKHTRFPNRYLGSANPLLSDQLMEQTRCLSHVYHDYQSKNRPQRAFLSVLQLVNKAEQVNINCSEMIIAYTCMMEFCQAKNWLAKAIVYERRAQKRCASNYSLTVDDYMSMGHLMCTSLTIKLASGFISEAIETGYTTHKVISKLHDNDVHMGTLPNLTLALMLSHRVSDAAEVLGELEYIDFEADLVIGKTWFYGCCLEFLVELGVQLESFDKCYSFLVGSSQDAVFQMDTLPLYFACSCMALWYQRRRMESQATLWREKAEALDPAPPIPTVITLNCKLKLLEITLLRLVQAHVIKHEDNISILKKRAKSEMKECAKWCKRIPVLLPRLFHLKAYYSAIILDRKVVPILLRQAVCLAEKHTNKMEIQWVRHSLSTWANAPARSNEKCKQAAFWERKGNVSNAIDWHLVRGQDAHLIKYTLPLN